MLLKSNLFAGDARLEACAASHQDHVTPGATGPHVRKIQEAVMTLVATVIDQIELDASHYGPSTASAVLAYKTKRDIVNHSYQSFADNIVGIMTIKALDAELLVRQIEVMPRLRTGCPHQSFWRPQVDKVHLAETLWSEAQRTRQPDVAAAMRFGDDEVKLS